MAFCVSMSGSATAVSYTHLDVYKRQVFHIVPYASFRAAWRYVYVIMLVVSASITPDASPVTLIFMYAVML